MSGNQRAADPEFRFGPVARYPALHKCVDLVPIKAPRQQPVAERVARYHVHPNQPRKHPKNDHAEFHAQTIGARRVLRSQNVSTSGGDATAVGLGHKRC
ncbi:hypothetical protein BD311DRAFT_748249 [Dichomitus squalens]|uniref:Uncharacterized protein n=1 Tax=Dichomitus squalens TaxID=114155 RepID=A0A4Q9N1D8_9APHY|nr:hypothetical protein BD311DRAFT_748249 [Dichomitus squalens]